MEKKLSDMTEEEIQAEIDQKSQAKAEEAAQALKTELDNAKKELEKLQNKDFDFSKMKEGEKALLDKITTLETSLKERDVREVTSKKTELIDAFAGANADLRKSLEENYAKLAMPEGTPQEIEARMKEAFTLATGARPDDNEDIMRRGSSAARSGRISVKNDSIDPNVSALAANFGKNGYKVTDEDIKKYNK